VCAWVVKLELACFDSGILFMDLSRSWGYKLKDYGVFKGARFPVLPILYLLPMVASRWKILLGGKNIMISLCFRRLNTLSLPLYNRFLLSPTCFYFSSGTFWVLSRFWFTSLMIVVIIKWHVLSNFRTFLIESLYFLSVVNLYGLPTT
jgi:hypothetical protein